MLKGFTFAKETELAVAVEYPELVEEEVAEAHGEHFDGQEEGRG